MISISNVEGFRTPSEPLVDIIWKRNSYRFSPIIDASACIFFMGFFIVAISASDEAGTVQDRLWLYALAVSCFILSFVFGSSYKKTRAKQAYYKRGAYKIQPCTAVDQYIRKTPGQRGRSYKEGFIRVQLMDGTVVSEYVSCPHHSDVTRLNRGETIDFYLVKFCDDTYDLVEVTPDIKAVDNDESEESRGVQTTEV